jgi:hypothetical protein
MMNWKNVEGCGCGQIEVLPMRLLGETEENNDKPLRTAYGWIGSRIGHFLNASLRALPLC